MGDRAIILLLVLVEYDMKPNLQNPCEVGFGLKLDGESDGDIEGALEKAWVLGDPMSKALSPSPYRLSGRGGYPVPLSVARVLVVVLDFIDNGDIGCSTSRPLLFDLEVDLGD